MISSLLTIFLGLANAQSVSVVHEVAQSTSAVIQTVSVSSYVATNMTASTSSGTIAGAFVIEIFNPAASGNTINCSFSASVSTTISNAWYGRELAQGSGIVYQVGSNKSVFCMTQSITQTTRATVTQLK